MTEQASEYRFIEGARDLGGLPALFSAAVGAPLLLNLLELATDYRLSTTFQWIVDSYRWLTAAMALAVEPLVLPLLAKINVGAGSHWVLYPHWRPLFVLMMVLLMGFGRVELREAMGADAPGGMKSRLRLIAIYAGSMLAGALVAGLMRLQGRWWEQGVVAAAPLTAFYIGMVLQTPRAKRSFDVVDVALLAAFATMFAIAALLSLVPGFERSAGMAVLAALVSAVGVWALVDGIRRRNRSNRRIGFGLLGGFMVAGAIVAADRLVG